MILEFNVRVDMSNSIEAKAVLEFIAAVSAEPLTNFTPQPAKQEKRKAKVTELTNEVAKEAQTEQVNGITEEAQPESNTTVGYTVEEVRALLAEKVEANRTDIKTKLTALGAANVTALDASKYVEFVEFLNSLD